MFKLHFRDIDLILLEYNRNRVTSMEKVSIHSPRISF